LKKGITVIAALVVVLAITSGGFAAANHYMITSSNQIKDGTVSVSNLSHAARKALKGQNGQKGDKGDKGDSGATGASGAQGPQGPQGAQGPQGPAGPQGPQGFQGAAGAPGKDAPAPQYGVAQVLVDRGSGASAWATYSTALGNPVSESTGGSFRFTCPASQTSCTISVQAAALGTSDPQAIGFYPRLLVYKSGRSATPALRRRVSMRTARPARAR
jgi:Collagen triple helix repeat (20 copies)